MSNVPGNIEAEKAVLGAMILDRTNIFAVQEVVSTPDFYLPGNRTVFGTILELADQGMGCDPITLDSRLREKEANVVWIDYINDLLAHTPTEEGALDYARIVADKAARRRMIGAGSKLNKLAQDEEGDLEQQIAEAEKEIFQIRGDSSNGGVEPNEYIDQYLKRFEELCDSDTDLPGLSTGYVDLDRITKGLKQNKHYMIAALSGMGKSSLALGILDNICATGEPGMLFALEMDTNEIMNRRVSVLTGIPLDMVDSPKQLSSNQRQAIQAATRTLRQRPLFIEDSAGLTISQIRAKAMRIKAKHGLRLVVVDHLHLITEEKSRKTEASELEHTVRSLTKMYQQLKVAGLTTVQLNRSLEHRNDKRPKLSDMRGSGAIEEEAYVAMFLHREADENLQPSNICDVLIRKNRNGPQGTVQLFWHAELSTFRNLSRQPQTGKVYHSNGTHPQETLEIF